MLRIGVIQVMDNILMLEGLEDFFDDLDVDWRLLYWPHHLNDCIMENIYVENIGKSFDYGRFSDRYKDFYGKAYMDYQEIRVLNEKWNPTPTEERIRIISEWVDGCDYILIDLSDCVHAEKERAMETVRGLAKTLKKEMTQFFIFDYFSVYEILGVKRRRVWDEMIEELKRTTWLYMENLEQIKVLEKNMINKHSTSEFCRTLQKAHNDRVKTILAEEICKRKNG